MTDSLRVWWKLPKLSDRLTMLVIVGTRSAEHSLRSQVGIGSESHCLLGQLNKILAISDSEAGLKVDHICLLQCNASAVKGPAVHS